MNKLIEQVAGKFGKSFVVPHVSPRNVFIETIFIATPHNHKSIASAGKRPLEQVEAVSFCQTFYW